MKFEIKIFVNGDIKDALELLSLWKSSKEEFISKRSDVQKLLNSKSFLCIVARVQNKVVGGLTAYTLEMFTRKSKELFLYEIEILKPFRNKEIGTTLLKTLNKFAKEKGIHEIFVFAEKENTTAQNFYKSMDGIEEASFRYSYKIDE